MSFVHPGLLWVLAALLPGLVLFFWWAWRERQRLIALFVPPRLQRSLTIGLSPGRARFRAILLILAVAALLMALARPRYGAGSLEVTQRGLDILVAIDTSRSMLAEDAGAGSSRLMRARLAALDLARLARTDRIGLIAFAGSAFLQCPLTIDDQAFRQSVEALDTEIIPEGGTAIGTAIAASLDAAKSRDTIRVLILFTDGEEHEAGALDAAQRAKDAGLRIFPVGVGTSRGELIRVRDEKGNEVYLKDSEGNVVKSSLNEPLLQKIAEITGGFYMPLTGPRPMDELFSRGLQPLPRADLESRLIEQFHERYQWPLSLALVLLMAEALLPERAPARGSPRALRRTHPTLATATSTLLCLAPMALHASTTSAFQDYNNGNYLAAEEEYDQLAHERPGDQRLRFNAGTAAFRAGAFQRAMSHFTESLRSSELGLQQDAYYNLGNAQFMHGQESADLPERRAVWEQAVRSFEAAIKLDPEDSNARHNLEYVRQRLEELKQEQQQQNEDQQQQDQEQEQEQENQEQQHNQQNQRHQEQEQQHQQDQQQDRNQQHQPQHPPQPDQQQSDQQQKEGDSQDQPENEQQDEPQKSDPQHQQDQPRQDPATNPPPDSTQASQADPSQSPEDVPAQDTRQMTPQQALRLLDASKDEDKPFPLTKRRARSRVLKDW
jgi:Ca-activated chloride channel family protein